MIVQNQIFTNIQPIRVNPQQISQPIRQKQDEIAIESFFVDKKPLIDKKIIKVYEGDFLYGKKIKI